MTFFGEGVGVESDKWVFRPMLLERVIESEETREICCVCYEGRPNYACSAILSICCAQALAPFFDSTTRRFVESAIAGMSYPLVPGLVTESAALPRIVSLYFTPSTSCVSS